MDASASYARYDFTSDLTQKAHWPRHQTVEDVILRGYFAIPEAEPEMALISDRQETSRLGLSDIISQIRRRYEIYEQQRKERVALWQDVSRLRQSLPEQAQGYLSQYRKLSILNESEGDDL